MVLDVSALRPMLAALADAPLRDARLAYEPKYDGIRALIELSPRAAGRRVRILSRLGNDKTAQFPEIVAALERFAAKVKAPVVLDGEIVALDPDGEPAGFQKLQSRIHGDGLERSRGRPDVPVAFIAFDLLRDGSRDLRGLPLVARRARLTRVFGNAGGPTLRLSEFVPGDGTGLYREALRRGWEGIVAKALESRYESGRRSPAWRKLKILKRQECVIGGWTEPRASRAHFGALLLGVWDAGALEYVGHAGTGFDTKELGRLARLLAPVETDVCPFRARPRANERPHWVTPTLVAEIKFANWTADGKLRAATYVGLRDDVPPESVRREPTYPQRGPRRAPSTPVRSTVPGEPRARLEPVAPLGLRYSDRVPPARLGVPPALQKLFARIEELEASRSGGVLVLPGGRRLEVGNLHKVFWKSLGITKGELMRYYVAVSPLILPAVADRPLVMRRFPNGGDAKAFYQQRAPARVPGGVRVESLPFDREVPSRLVGGSLATLLYMTQLATISQDPFFSRVGSIDFADHVALDLDPMPGVTFGRVLDVARWIHDELLRFGVPSVPKTSGAEGLHVYIPLRAGTTYESGRIFCEIVATLVSQQHPRVATVERSVDARGARVYVDFLQNIRGKTLATAYSARASAWAGVSTPLTWHEVHAGVERETFTLRTAPDRFRATGDLWAALRASPGADLGAALEAAARARHA